MNPVPQTDVRDSSLATRPSSRPKVIERGALRFRVYVQRREVPGVKCQVSGKTRRAPDTPHLTPRTYYTSHILSYRLNGQRHRVVRAQYADLLREIDAAETAIVNGQTDLLDFTHTDKALLQRLREIAAGTKAPLEILVAEAVEARRRAAASASIIHKNSADIVEELLDAKRAEDAGVRWIEDLDSRLARFAKEFPGPLSHLCAEALRTWLSRMNLSKRSWNNNRTALLALAAFAKDRHYLAADWNELAQLKPKKIVKGVEELYTPEELRSLLFTAEKHYAQHLPALAIMALAGCRHCELRDDTAALDWKRVHFAEVRGAGTSLGMIHVDELVAKSNTGRRYVPMQPSLAAWLEPYVKPRGPVCVVSNLTNALGRIATKSGVAWKQNGLRNSFISYRCAVLQNVAQVAAEAGNSVGEIHKSYRKEITPEEGQRWFDIWPTKADVLPLFAYRAK